MAAEETEVVESKVTSAMAVASVAFLVVVVAEDMYRTVLDSFPKLP